MEFEKRVKRDDLVIFAPTVPEEFIEDQKSCVLLRMIELYRGYLTDSHE